MGPLVGAALVQAGGAILGGLLGRTKPVSAAQSFQSHMKGVMASAEKYGFNPLTLLGVNSPGFSPGDNSSMSAGIANAGMYLGDALSKKTDAAKLQQATAQNQVLQNKVQSLTLRPKVPGIYGAPRMGGPDASSPVTPAATGVATPVPSGLNLGDTRELIKTDRGSFADGRRPVDNQPVKSHSGYIVVDNPSLPIPLRVPTLDGDEPLHWYDYPDLLLPGILAAKDFVGAISDDWNSNSSLGLNPPTDADMRMAADEISYNRLKRARPKKRPAVLPTKSIWNPRVLGNPNGYGYARP